MSKSSDGGQTWEASVVDDSGLVCVSCLTTPEATIDPDTGDLYLVFEQSNSPVPNARDNRDIWFMRSTDGGETWSDRQRLNDDDDEARDPGYDQLFPGVDVAPDGRIDVAWYDFRTDALYNPAGTGKTDRSEETCWDVFSTYSTDGGETWAYIGWSDSRAGHVDLPAEDAYLASVVHRADNEEGSSIQPNSVALGAGIGLLIAGLAALVVTRAVRTSRT